jgi:GNAT superfamily N-acetyltransferase
VAIRPATEADLPRLVELLAQLDPADPAREDMRSPLPFDYHLAWRQIVSTPGQHVLLLESRRKIVATLALSIIPNLSHKGSPYAIIENMVVDERARSKGHGERLVRHAIEEAKRAGCYKVSLTSNKRRKDAHRFYERLGFDPTHEGFRMTFDLSFHRRAPEATGAEKPHRPRRRRDLLSGTCPERSGRL